MNVTLLFEGMPGAEIPFAAGAERYQRFADELSVCCRVPVPIVQGKLQSAPKDGFLLFATEGNMSKSLSPVAPSVCARTIVLDSSPLTTLELLEKHRLAGAIDSLRLSEWLARPSKAVGPFGLRYLAASLGARLVPLPPLNSPHYGLFQRDTLDGLPKLLGDYLAIYERDQTRLAKINSLSLSKSPLPQRGEQRFQFESVGVGRVINTLKRLRENSKLTPDCVARRVGIDPEAIGVLEGDNYRSATLGMLRCYVLALQEEFGWKLSTEIPSTQSDVEEQPNAINSVYLQPLIARQGMTVQSQPSSNRSRRQLELGRQTTGVQQELY